MSIYGNSKTSTNRKHDDHVPLTATAPSAKPVSTNLPTAFATIIPPIEMPTEDSERQDRTGQKTVNDNRGEGKIHSRNKLIADCEILILTSQV